MHPHLFSKKNPNQLYPKKMINKYANTLHNKGKVQSV